MNSNVRAITHRPAQPAHSVPTTKLRANDTILIGDLLIMVQSAVEQSRDTGQPFGECLVAAICEELDPPS